MVTLDSETAVDGEGNALQALKDLFSTGGGVYRWVRKAGTWSCGEGASGSWEAGVDVDLAAGQLDECGKG